MSSEIYELMKRSDEVEVVEKAHRRPRFVECKRRVVPVKRRAIGTDDFGCVAHVEKHVRMVERRVAADAHELLRADLDDGNSGIVVEVRDDMIGHRLTSGREQQTTTPIPGSATGKRGTIETDAGDS